MVTWLEYTILLLSLVSSVFLIYKCIEKKDLSLLGSAIPRMFIVYLMLTEIVSGTITHAQPRLSIVVLFICDMLVGLLNYFTEKKKDLENGLLVTSLRHKLNAALDNSLIPFFTVDINGKIEYANQNFSDLVGIKREILPGRNIVQLLGIECSTVVEDLKNNNYVHCNIKTKDGYKEAKIIGKETLNGHTTITGSIYTA